MAAIAQALSRVPGIQVDIEDLNPIAVFSGLLISSEDNGNPNHPIPGLEMSKVEPLHWYGNF